VVAIIPSSSSYVIVSTVELQQINHADFLLWY
jgi:hypothetical protein